MNAKTYRAVGAMFCVAAMLLCMIKSFAIPVNAADCEFSLVCKNQSEPVADVSWSVFRIGEKNSKGEYVLTGDFADYPVSLKNIETSSEMQNVAVTLENYAVLDKVTPVLEGVSDAEGNVALGNVGVGLYLVCGEKITSDTRKVIPAPMFLEFTDEDIAQGNIVAYPKFEIENFRADSKAEFGVKKIWDMLDKSEDLRPSDITVGIYRDGELVEKVVLNSENNWEYFWTGEPRYDWRVKEIDIADNFTVIYRKNETLFNVENTYSDDDGGDSSMSSSVPDSSISQPDSSVSQPDTSSSKTDTSSKTSSSGGGIPQTGSLWWPVPVLAGAGVIFIAVGGRMNKKKQ